MEHGFFNKRYIYDEAMRIPLIIRFPAEIKLGLVIGELAGNTDLAPIILDFAGISVPLICRLED